jgi:septal ring factor EnvC (AmiA/AmiB activator)
MSQQRKSAIAREKDLRLAMYRIERGRAHTKATKVSVASVAREVGISAALIHNHYPAIADAIRQSQGRSSRTQLDAKHKELKAQRDRSRELRQEITSLRADVAKLASINEVLLAENAVLRAQLNDPQVVQINSQR